MPDRGKILILGGTKEAAELARLLVDEGHDVTTSLAGRTREPLPASGVLRVGGFGGAEGLAAYLSGHGFTRLIDATHPFARRISANAKEAARMTGIAFEAIERPAWQKQAGDSWIEVSSLEEAARAIPAGSRVLLALGSQHIAVFASRGDVRFMVRMVDEPAVPPTLPDHEVLIGMPSPDWQEEARIFQEKRVTHLVCRNSGGAGAYAKIEAARRLGLPVIMVGR